MKEYTIVLVGKIPATATITIEADSEVEARGKILDKDFYEEFYENEIEWEYDNLETPENIEIKKLYCTSLKNNDSYHYYDDYDDYPDEENNDCYNEDDFDEHAY